MDSSLPSSSPLPSSTAPLSPVVPGVMPLSQPSSVPPAPVMPMATDPSVPTEDPILKTPPPSAGDGNSAGAQAASLPPKKQGASRKLIAGVAALVLLVVGLGVGLALVGTGGIGEIRKQAAGTCTFTSGDVCVGNNPEGACFQGGQNNAYACYWLAGNPGKVVAEQNTDCTCPGDHSWKNHEYSLDWCFNTAVQCDHNSGTTMTVPSGPEAGRNTSMQCSINPEQCTPVASPTPITLFCGNCDNFTCGLKPIDQCTNDSNPGDGVCEGNCNAPSPTPTTVLPSPTPVIPNCYMSGPTCLDVGQPATFTGNFSSAQGNLKGELFRDEHADLTGAISLKIQALPGTSGSFTADWMPTSSDIGSHMIYCRAWNDAIAECRPPQFVDGPPRYACVGSHPGAADYQLAVEVKTACNPATPTPTVIVLSPTPTPIFYSQCVDVIAQTKDSSGNWVDVPGNDLSAVGYPGLLVRFKGIASASLPSGQQVVFTFNINGTDTAPTSSNPISGTDRTEYFVEYTLSAGALTVQGVVTTQ